MTDIKTNDTLLPKMEKNEPFYKYLNRLNDYYVSLRYDKRKKILQFINEWMFGLTKSKYYKNLTDFKDVLYRDLPNDKISKEYLKEHFEKYNSEFDLDLEYDEELFTTYNVMYFIKLMLIKVNGNIKKEIIDHEIKKRKIAKRKKYTIFLK
jgi:hypothetical protein